MGKIIAIGGGQSKIKSSIMYEEMRALSNKKNPKVIIITAASKDIIKPWIKENIAVFKRLRFKVEPLYLVKKKSTISIMEDKILHSDIIYVCGGSTKFLMDTLIRTGADKIVKKAYNKDILIAGSSAGANFLFKHSNSDYLREKNPDASYVRLDGLGIVNAFCCPHYDTEKKRKSSLKEMLKKSKLIAIALDEGAAIEIVENEYRVLTGIRNAHVYKTYWKDEKYHQLKLSEDKKFKPLKGLLSK
jgi:dipeptidase E